MKIFTVSEVFESTEIYGMLTHTRSFSSYDKAFNHMKEIYNITARYYKDTCSECFIESNIDDMNARVYFLPRGKNYENDYRLATFTINETELIE